MMDSVNILLDGDSVTRALRSAYEHRDMESMRRICANVSDKVLKDIGIGNLEIRGDSESGFLIYKVDRKYLWPTPYDGERCDRDRIDVTGRSDRYIEKVSNGVLTQINSKDYYLDEVTVQGEPYHECYD